jgi:hypothetical protein
MDGTSFGYTFDAAERHTAQYLKMFGSRAMYKDGWWAASRPDRPPGHCPTNSNRQRRTNAVGNLETGPVPSLSGFLPQPTPMSRRHMFTWTPGHLCPYCAGFPAQARTFAFSRVNSSAEMTPRSRRSASFASWSAEPAGDAASWT